MSGVASGPTPASAVPLSPRRGRPKTPGIVHTGVVALVLAVVGTLALTAPPPAPPTIAEFAPQAVEQIQESLPEQESDVGEPPPVAAGSEGSEEAASPSPSPAASASPSPSASASASERPSATPSATPSASASGTPSATPTPSPEVSESPPPPRARTNLCVGDPPRQTEDPQSPPCVAYWDGEGGNGGATAPQGVTDTTITVAYPMFGFGDDPQLTRDLVEHFNRRYEFYGREIVLAEFMAGGGGFAQPDPTLMQGDAAAADEQLKAFASIAYADRKGAEHYYYDELARRGIISVAYRAQALASEDRYAEYAPYEWNVLQGADEMMREYGAFVCRSLNGGPPIHAGTGTEDLPERVFGLIYQETPEGTRPPIDDLLDTLSSCGITIDESRTWVDRTDLPRASEAMVKMQTGGVTSVMCVCPGDQVRREYMVHASSRGYIPEWVLSGYIDQDLDNTMHGAPPEQASHVIGVTFRNKLLPRQDMWWYRAAREVDPGNDPSGGIYYDAMSRYAQLLLLASGIQLAGPELTAESFERGLHEAMFPNPGAGGPPYYQAHVGFDGGEHTMYDGASLFWYSETDGGTIDPAYPGAVCYVLDGTRFLNGAFPEGEPGFYDGSCR